MFDILLQRNNSEKNRVTKDLTLLGTATGVLREQTSIVDPVVRIECNLADVVKCNYITIAAFGRSYFVNNITSVRQGLVEFQCHVDVLSTYATEIKGTTAIIRRQENDWNLYLNDGTFKVYQNPTVLTKAFPSGFTTQELVLAVAGS